MCCSQSMLLLSCALEQKADRRALEGKASREWVDSTFERLDKEIREAKAHLLGQQEAFKTAVSQLNEDVEGKLDRMELEPLKEYFGGCVMFSALHWTLLLFLLLLHRQETCQGQDCSGVH